MSYEPSHWMPPRQEGWPAATPAEGWPSYLDGEQEALRYGAQGAAAGYRQQAVATAAYPAATSGYDWSGSGYAGAVEGYAGAGDDFDAVQDGYGRAGHGYSGGNLGYADTGDGYTRAHDGYVNADNGYNWADAAYTGDADGYDWSGNGYGGGAYLGPGSYVEPGAVQQDNRAVTDDPTLTAPDAGIHPDRWQAEQELRRETGRRGPMVGAITEVLAIGVVIGVSTLAAALLKSVTSPASAMGAVFIAHTPAALRNAVEHHFGAQGRTVLLLAMYVIFALLAIVIGMMARRDAAVGVAGVAAFTVFAAFVVLIRPGSHMADVAPAVIGGMAGVAAVLWLFRAAVPQRVQGPVQLGPAPVRHGHGTRRRTR